MGSRQDLIQKALGTIRPRNFSLYVYGSYASQPSAARDVDLVMITSDVKQPKLRAFDYSDGGRLTPCNFYCVPIKNFEADVQTLAYGGFYSHKFAFSFELLAKGGRAFDPADHFWMSEASRLARHGQHPKTADELVRQVHRDIFRFDPFVGRAMTKFLTRPGAGAKLQRYVAERLIESSLDQLHGLNETEWRSCAEKAVHLFWAEYIKFKSSTDSEVWPEPVRQKMIRSLAESDFVLINSYLNEFNS